MKTQITASVKGIATAPKLLERPEAPARTDIDIASKLMMVKRKTTSIILDIEIPNFDYSKPAEVGHDDWRVYFVPLVAEFCCARFHRVHGTQVESDFKTYDRARTAADLMNAAAFIKSMGLEF